MIEVILCRRKDSFPALQKKYRIRGVSSARRYMPVRPERSTPSMNRRCRNR